MADKPEGIGVLLAVDIEPGPFLPGPGIYPVGLSQAGFVTLKKV